MEVTTQVCPRFVCVCARERESERQRQRERESTRRHAGSEEDPSVLVERRSNDSKGFQGFNPRARTLGDRGRGAGAFGGAVRGGHHAGLPSLRVCV